VATITRVITLEAVSPGVSDNCAAILIAAQLILFLLCEDEPRNLLNLEE
jgi:hypothetical protein